MKLHTLIFLCLALLISNSAPAETKSNQPNLKCISSGGGFKFLGASYFFCSAVEIQEDLERLVLRSQRSDTAIKQIQTLLGAGANPLPVLDQAQSWLTGNVWSLLQVLPVHQMHIQDFDTLIQSELDSASINFPENNDISPRTFQRIFKTPRPLKERPLIDFLLSRGVRINLDYSIKTKNISTLLESHKYLQLLKAFIRNGFDANANYLPFSDKEIFRFRDETLMQTAAFNACIECIEYLIEQGTSPNGHTNITSNLYSAISGYMIYSRFRSPSRYFRVIDLLLKQGALLNNEREMNDLAERAKARGHLEITELLQRVSIIQ